MLACDDDMLASGAMVASRPPSTGEPLQPEPVTAACLPVAQPVIAPRGAASAAPLAPPLPMSAAAPMLVLPVVSSSAASAAPVAPAPPLPMPPAAPSHAPHGTRGPALHEPDAQADGDALEVEAEIDDEEHVPTMGVDPTFLEKGSQSHANPLTAFGDIFDNSKESGAKCLRVSARRAIGGGDTLVLSDDGRGLSEATMHNAMAMIGHSTKDLDHYGFGAKTALPRLAQDSLIFSRCEDSPGVWSLLLLSTRHSGRMRARELRVPICSWSNDSSTGRVAGREPEVLKGSSDEAPLRASHRRDSLASLLDAEGLPYASEADLLREFRDAFGGQRFGTRIVMWSLTADIDLRPKKFDITWNGKGKASAPRHEVSLRSYSEVLYLQVGERVVPSLQIFIFGQSVDYRDWDEYLSELPMEMPLPQPDVKAIQAQHALTNGGSGTLSVRQANHLGRIACASLTLGYARSIADLVEVLSARTSGAQQATEKKVVEEMETGIYVYHQGRLTRPLEKLPITNRPTNQNVSRTTTLRITTLGHGLTGYIDENYLKPTHNKAAYFDSKLFSDLMDQANAKSIKFIVQRTVPKFALAMGGSIGKLGSGGLCLGFGKQAHGKQPMYTQPKPPKPPKPPQPQPKPKPKPVALEEDTRMQPVNRNDKQVGRLVRAETVPAGIHLPRGGLGRYFLRLEDGTLSTQTYRPRYNLLPCTLDAASPSVGATGASSRRLSHPSPFTLHPHLPPSPFTLHPHTLTLRPHPRPSPSCVLYTAEIWCPAP